MVYKVGKSSTIAKMGLLVDDDEDAAELQIKI
jgi:hypothetical protein